jgi:hypothetical protein
LAIGFGACLVSMVEETSLSYRASVTRRDYSTLRRSPSGMATNSTELEPVHETRIVLDPLFNDCVACLIGLGGPAGVDAFNR